MCYLYATSYEGIQTSAVIPAICLTGLHLLYLCMEYWLLYFLQDIKDIQALIFVCVCVRACMCMCLKWYCYHFWRLITAMYVRVKANKFHSSKGKKKKMPSNAFKEYIQNETIHTEVLTYAMKTICNCCSFFPVENTQIWF